MGGLGHSAVARELVLLGQAEVVRLVHEGDGRPAEEDPEEAVEAALDLREERRHVGRAERDARGAHRLAARLLDLLDVGIAGGLAPCVVEVDEVPLLAHLVDEVRREGHRLRGGVVERPERVAAALARRDRGVQAHAHHVDELVLLVHGHAGQAHVREIAPDVRVDLVLDHQLLGAAAAHVRLGLVVADEQLDGPAVEAVHGHLHAHQRRLAAGRRRAGERLKGADLEGLGLSEGATPPRGYGHRGAQRAGGGGAEAQEAAPRGLAAVPEILPLSPSLLFPALCHDQCPPCGRQLRWSIIAANAAVNTWTVCSISSSPCARDT